MDGDNLLRIAITTLALTPPLLCLEPAAIKPWKEQ